MLHVGHLAIKRGSMNAYKDKYKIQSTRSNSSKFDTNDMLSRIDKYNSNI